jgi:hypothetical protein
MENSNSKKSIKNIKKQVQATMVDRYTLGPPTTSSSMSNNISTPSPNRILNTENVITLADESETESDDSDCQIVSSLDLKLSKSSIQSFIKTGLKVEVLKNQSYLAAFSSNSVPKLGRNPSRTEIKTREASMLLKNAANKLLLVMTRLAYFEEVKSTHGQHLSSVGKFLTKAHEVVGICVPMLEAIGMTDISSDQLLHKFTKTMSTVRRNLGTKKRKTAMQEGLR